MQPAIMWTVVALSLALAVVGVVTSALDRLPGRFLLGCALVTELAVLVQSEVAGMRLARGLHLEHTVTVIGYLFGVVLVLPIAVAWALGERTRWSGVVVSVGAVTIVLMTFRVNTLWVGTGA